jgi:glycosyltransferase involved in cell wall biosynthesis
MKDLAEKMGLRKVLFLGHVDHDRDLPDLYACADYYLMTSEYEGLPLTLLEAMASGLPCIVSDLPNLEIVRDADCGIVVDFTDQTVALADIRDYLKLDRSSWSWGKRRKYCTTLVRLESYNWALFESI